MRGFPFLNLVLALLLSGVVLLPLVYRATRSAAMAVEPGRPAAADPDGRISSHVSLHFVHAPVTVRLKDGAAVLHEWAAPGGARLLEDTVVLPFSDNRTEITVQITWPAGTPETNVEIRVEPDGKASRKDNVWSSGAAADELVTLTWEGTP